MANTRRKTSGFEKLDEGELAPVLIDEDVTNDEQTEMNEEIIAITETPPVVIESTPFIEPTIVPTPDAGPRFLDTPPVVEPTPKAPTQAPTLLPPPKRRPRNVPRLSRTR